jgi:hypothetical protein
MSAQVMWIVGSCMSTSMEGTMWSLAGVFDSEASAVAACTDADDFIRPAPINQPIPPLPYERGKWSDCRYPLAEVSA